MELALLLPFLLTLMTAIVEFGFYLYDLIGAQSALRAGATAAILTDKGGNPIYNEDQLRQIMQSAHGPVNALLPDEMKVTSLPADPAFGGAYTSVTILIDHRHEFIFPVFFFEGRNSLQVRTALKTFRVAGLSP